MQSKFCSLFLYLFRLSFRLLHTFLLDTTMIPLHWLFLPCKYLVFILLIFSNLTMKIYIEQPILILVFIIFRYPFSYKNLLGYLATVVIQTPTLFAATEIFVIALTLSIGLCWFVTTFVTDLEESLRMLNADIIAMKRINGRSSRRTNIRKRIVGIIQFHLESKEFSILISILDFHRIKPFPLA